VQKKFSKLREDSLHFLINFPNSLVGQYSADLIELLVEKDKILFSSPPFTWKTNGKIGYGKNATFYNSLIRRVLLSYSLFDTIVGYGKYDLSEFPTEISTSRASIDFIEHNIRKQLSEIRNVN
jgi:hypothetical protein